jgi:hypothetical protein
MLQQQFIYKKNISVLLPYREALPDTSTAGCIVLTAVFVWFCCGYHTSCCTCICDGPEI